MSDDPTLGEVSRNVAALRLDMATRLDRLDRKFDQLPTTFVTAERYNAETAAIRTEIKALKDDLAEDIASRKADRRLLFGAVLAVVGNIVLQVLRAYPGAGS